MTNKSATRGLAITMLALGLLATAAAEGQGTPANVRDQLAKFHEDWVAAGKPESPRVAPKWGTDDYEVYNVHAYDFQANTTTDLVMDDGNGYRYFGAPSIPYMAAPVRLPAGVQLGGISISHCSAEFRDIYFALYDNLSAGNGSSGGNLVAGPFGGSQGCHWEGYGARDYVYTNTADHPLYLVVYFAREAWDDSIKFNTLSVSFRRLVSDPPLGVTFDDVPPTDFGFDHIEALAASGITGGCGGGNYCPDQPVTRRQMAIFLAKALGLSWAE